VHERDRVHLFDENAWLSFDHESGGPARTGFATNTPHRRDYGAQDFLIGEGARNGAGEEIRWPISFPPSEWRSLRNRLMMRSGGRGIMAYALKTPTHLWIVGIVSTLWNAFGTLDYTMTQTKNVAWLSQITAEQRAWIESAPVWAEAAWAFGVWGALAGSILLLMRSRHAVAAFAVSLGGLAFNTFWQFFATNGSAIMGRSAVWVNVAIWAIAIALLLYARAMKARDVLR
jgi:hypothetical protein